MTLPDRGPARTGAPTLQAVALAGQRGDRPLFRGLALRLEAGQVVWLRGRNGRGKTSLLRLLAGLSTPLQGQVLLDGQPLPAAVRAGLLYIAHANALKDDLRVSEALSFLARLQGLVPTDADVGAALERLGLAGRAQAFVRTLSQGQRRRAALARLALPQPPAVWLLDEPFDALDDLGVAALNGLLSAHAARGGSALLTSHQPLALNDPLPAALNLDDFALAA